MEAALKLLGLQRGKYSAERIVPFAAPNVNDMEATGATADVNVVLEWQQAQ